MTDQKQVSYRNRHLLKVVMTLSQKIMSNYINHIAKKPVDGRFN
ncbi:hypothetical protein [Marinobacter sp. GH_1]